MGTNFMNTIKYFTRFLAGQTHPEFNAVERKHIFGKTIEMDGKTIFEVEYEGKPTIFRAEQLTASHISELVKKYNQPIYISVIQLCQCVVSRLLYRIRQVLFT